MLFLQLLLVGVVFHLRASVASAVCCRRAHSCTPVHACREQLTPPVTARRRTPGNISEPAASHQTADFFFFFFKCMNFFFFYSFTVISVVGIHKYQTGEVLHFLQEHKQTHSHIQYLLKKNQKLLANIWYANVKDCKPDALHVWEVTYHHRAVIFTFDPKM